jgi:benzoyl-CoA reductase subunit C
VFEEFRRIIEQRHDYAREWKKKTGGKVIGYFCSNVPEPLIYAAGVLPVRIFGSSEATLDAEKYTHPMWCSFCRDSFALSTCAAASICGRHILAGRRISPLIIHMKS